MQNNSSRPGANKKLQADIQNAFKIMGYTVHTKLPKKSVLERAPRPGMNEHCCPPQLWDVVNKYGSFFNATYNPNGIKRYINTPLVE